MPVIQTFDPLSAASEAVGAFSDRKRANETEQKARDYQAARDTRRDMESDRTYGIQKGEADDSHAATLSKLQTDEQNRKIASATEEYNAKLRPIQLQMDALNVKKTQGEILGQADERKLKGLQVAAATVDLEIKQKYGRKEAEAGLKAAQANASAATQHAAFAGKMDAASLAQTQASTNATNASAAETNYRMHSGVDDYHAPSYGGRGGAGRGTATERAQAAYDDAMGALSDTGRAFYESLYSTNNPPTRAQAMLAAHAAAKNGSGVTPNDVKHLETLIASRESQFVTPGSQQAATRSDARAETSAARNTTRDHETEFRDVTKGRAFAALTIRLREKVRAAMVDSGMSVQSTVEAVDASNMPDGDKQAIHRALSGG